MVYLFLFFNILVDLSVVQQKVPWLFGPVMLLDQYLLHQSWTLLLIHLKPQIYGVDTFTSKIGNFLWNLFWEIFLKKLKILFSLSVSSIIGRFHKYTRGFLSSKYSLKLLHIIAVIKLLPWTWKTQFHQVGIIEINSTWKIFTNMLYVLWTQHSNLFTHNKWNNRRNWFKRLLIF